jgi:hypothetical protein
MITRSQMSKDRIWKVDLYEKARALPSGTAWTSYHVRADSIQEAIEKAEIAAKDDGLTLVAAGSCHFVLYRVVLIEAHTGSPTLVPRGEKLVV